MQTLTLMERLKEDTKAAHNSAEGNKLQAELGSGAIDRETYQAYMSQLYLLHKALENGIKSSIAASAYRDAITNDHYQEPILHNDLKALGVDCESIKPLKGTSKLIENIDEYTESCPPALLGYHYVLLGSKHGGKFLAKRLQDQFKFADGVGCKYFDPYGQAFMPLWLAFKQKMNDNAGDEREQQKIIEAAKGMFTGIQQICDEICAAR